MNDNRTLTIRFIEVKDNKVWYTLLRDGQYRTFYNLNRRNKVDVTKLERGKYYRVKSKHVTNGKHKVHFWTSVEEIDSHGRPIVVLEAKPDIFNDFFQF